jgi:hypothetical protein|uniref:STI1 domain-containing protein n=1 Tax=viral metagenome TaxID=1070528 RepID=A0A6C0IRT2_9ZZZZ
MEELLGNANIIELQKQVLSDPAMKQTVEQVLKNPEMLDQFKNFFKGGRKRRKSYRRRKRKKTKRKRKRKKRTRRKRR